MNASSVNHETKFTTLHFIYFLGIFLRWSVSEGLEKKWNLLPTNWRQSILVPESVLWHGDRRRRMDGIFKHTFCLCFFFSIPFIAGTLLFFLSNIRSCNDVTTLANPERTSIEDGLITNTGSEIQIAKFGSETKTFTCWPTVKTTSSGSS